MSKNVRTAMFLCFVEFKKISNEEYLIHLFFYRSEVFKMNILISIYRGKNSLEENLHSIQSL